MDIAVKCLEFVVKNIVHVLRTPLVVIQVGIMTVSEYLPILIKAYLWARTHGMNIEDIPPKKLEALEKLLANGSKEAHFIKDYVNDLEDQWINTDRGEG